MSNERTAASILAHSAKQIGRGYANFRRDLKRFRHHANMSQAALADHLGITAVAVSNIETGESHPSENTITAFVTWLTARYLKE